MRRRASSTRSRPRSSATGARGTSASGSHRGTSSSSPRRTPSRTTSDWLATARGGRALGTDDVAGAYGRQLPHADARPPERFFLDFLYGPEPRVQRLEPGDELTFEATLFSNVNAAMHRGRLERYPFRDDLTMSEDQEWSRRVLRAGYSLVYEPLAAVRHSHAYTIASAFRRFFDSGVSAEHAYVEGDASRAALRRAGPLRARGARLALADRAAALDPVHGRVRARQVRRPPAGAPPPAAPAPLVGG